MSDPAQRLREEAADAGVWKPMTDVLHLFEERRLTSPARERIAAALDGAGLDAAPPIATAQRWQLLHLFPRGGAPAGHAIRSVSHWRPGAAGEDAELADAAEDSTVVWVELGPGDTPGVAAAVGARLGAPVDDALLVDLESPDERPAAHTLDFAGGVWKLSSVAIVAQEHADGEVVNPGSTVGHVKIRTVELVVGPGWIVSCWNESRTLGDVRPITDDGPDAPAGVMDTVAEVWTSHHAASPYTLVAILLSACAIEYASVIETLDSWYDQWQLAHRDPAQSIGRDTLLDLRGFVIGLRRRVGPLLELLDKLGDEWPSLVPADEHVAFKHALGHAERRTFATLRALEHFDDTLQSAFGILSSEDTQQQRAQTDRVHDRLDIVSAVFLVPALIAGIYGANTAIPGGGEWWGFAAMFVLMLLGIALALLYLGKFPYEPVMRRWPKALRRRKHA
jgi:hypothetical protein